MVGWRNTFSCAKQCLLRSLFILLTKTPECSSLTSQPYIFYVFFEKIVEGLNIRKTESLGHEFLWDLCSFDQTISRCHLLINKITPADGCSAAQSHKTNNISHNKSKFLPWEEREKELNEMKCVLCGCKRTLEKLWVFFCILSFVLPANNYVGFCPILSTRKNTSCSQRQRVCTSKGKWRLEIQVWHNKISLSSFWPWKYGCKNDVRQKQELLDWFMLSVLSNCSDWTQTLKKCADSPSVEALGPVLWATQGSNQTCPNLL